MIKFGEKKTRKQNCWKISWSRLTIGLQMKHIREYSHTKTAPDSRELTLASITRPKTKTLPSEVCLTLFNSNIKLVLDSTSQTRQDWLIAIQLMFLAKTTAASTLAPKAPPHTKEMPGPTCKIGDPACPCWQAKEKESHREENGTTQPSSKYRTSTTLSDQPPATLPSISSAPCQYSTSPHSTSILCKASKTSKTIQKEKSSTKRSCCRSFKSRRERWKYKRGQSNGLRKTLIDWNKSLSVNQSRTVNCRWTLNLKRNRIILKTCLFILKWMFRRSVLSNLSRIRWCRSRWARLSWSQMKNLQVLLWRK